MLSPGKSYLYAHCRSAERNSHCFSPNIYWRVPLELGNNKLISDTTSVQFKCHLSSSCYFIWGPLWIIHLSSGPWCLQMTFGQLSASLYCLETKLYVPWSVCGVSYPNRSQVLFTDSWVPGILSEILGGHTIFKVIISPSGCSIVGKICCGFSTNKGSGIELSYTKRKK